MTPGEKDLRRFFSKLKEMPNGCIEYTGGRSTRGYGVFHFNGTSQYAHRVMFQSYHKLKLEPDEFVMHQCDNKICCNPHHLKKGSLLENVQECVERGLRAKKGKKRRQLTTAEVLRVLLFLKNKQSAYAIARHFDCGETTIRDIRSRRTWSHLKLPAKPIIAYDPFTDV